MPLSPMLTPQDGGLIYTETKLNQAFPEPLNAITAAIFLLLALYWIVKLKGFNPRHTFLSISSWILLVGSIGGTAYHGLRKYSFFIPMDWVPIALLCLLASLWLWQKVLNNLIFTFIAFVGFILLEILIFFWLKNTDRHAAININYGIMGLMVLLPIILFLAKTHFHHAQWIFIAVFSFGLALFFRIADKWAILSVGTHFLWHSFGALATAGMFRFIYRINDNTLDNPSKKTATSIASR